MEQTESTTDVTDHTDTGACPGIAQASNPTQWVGKTSNASASCDQVVVDFDVAAAAQGVMLSGALRWPRKG
jgi:hypothetical protein